MNKRPKKDMSRNLPGSRVTQTPAGFSRLLKEVKARIQQSQMRAVLSANAELVRLYWDIGRMIDQRQQQEGWGAAVIPRLARELHNELPQVKGFSERNIKRMLAFYRAYPSPAAFLSLAAAKLPDGKNSPESAAHIERSPKVPQAVAQLAATKKMPQAVAQIASANESILWSIPWGHHAGLMDKVDLEHRLWYMHQTLANGWSRNVLLLMIKSEAHLRQGKALSNFERLLSIFKRRATSKRANRRRQAAHFFASTERLIIMPPAKGNGLANPSSIRHAPRMAVVSAHSCIGGAS